ncbi:MAG: alpha/beta hydrolase family protein [Candidatus Nanohaloarchaea archaeon]
MTEEKRIEVEDGEKVSLVHHSADADRWIFFCHGFGANRDFQQERSEKAAENGFNAVRFDFRGNGDSDGDFIEQDLSSRIEDLKSVVRYFEPERAALFGSSFGGKVAFHAALDLEVDAVIGKAPATYSEVMDKFRSVLEKKETFSYIDGKPIDDRFFDDFDSYSFDDVTSGLEAPVLIFHGSEDTTVHPEHSFRAVKEFRTDVTLRKLPGEEHRYSDRAERKMMETMFDFLDRL